MFRITFLVDDKQLAHALRSLAGIARGEPQVVPVVNAEPTRNGGVKARTAGDPIDLLCDYMRRHKMDEITGPQAREAYGEMGLPTTSYSHYLARAVRTKRLKDMGIVKGHNYKLFGLVLLREAKP